MESGRSQHEKMFYIFIFSSIVRKYVARGSDDAVGVQATFFLGSVHDGHEGMIAGKDASDVASEAEESVL